MHALIAELHQDHVNLGKLLSLLDRELVAFRQGGHPDYLLLQEVIDYVESYPDLVHHPREDVIFKVYLERHQAGAECIEALMREHHELVQQSGELRSLIDQVVNGSVLERDVIGEKLSRYIRLQRDHLNAEEGEIFALLDDKLQQDDWRRIEVALPAAVDPIFGGSVQKRYQAIYDRIMLIA